MNKIRISLLLAATFALTSCLSITGGLKPQEEKPLPAWVLSPPSDDRRTYFGIGQGSDLNQEKQAALQEISSKISASVGGRSEAVNTLYNDAFQQSAFTQVRSETQDKELQNYQVEQSSVHKGLFYALISLAKLDLARSWETKLKRLDQAIEAEVSALIQQSILEQYVAWQQIKPRMTQASLLASFINTVDPNFQTISYETRHLNYSSKADNALNNLNAYVQSEAKYTPIGKTIIKQLAKQGIKASASKTNQYNYQY